MSALRVLAARLRRRAVPNRWSFMFGVASLACLTVLVVTGIFLLFFYDPSTATIKYEGSYAPLQGVEVSRAFNSTLNISFEVRGGLLMRQAHHWAALVLPATLMLQMLSTFFAGGFRRPRRLGWVLLCFTFLLALAAGWSGYALPDDMLSGTGLRIVEGIVIGIPVVGTRLSTLLVGGQFPGDLVTHLYWVHILIVPVGLLPVVVARMLVARRTGLPQVRGPGRTEGNTVGLPLLPTAAVKAVGYLLLTTGVLILMAGTLTISPIWLLGPSSPANASAGSQPDWYTGFLDGALRLVPPGWEVVWSGRTWPLAVLIPQAVVGIFLTLVVAYPWLEGWLTGDTTEHHLLDRPRDAPTRTGAGVAGIVFFGTLSIAGSTDLLAVTFHLTIEGLDHFLQVLVILGPVAAFVLTRQICLGLQARDRETVQHGVATGTIVRLPNGGYQEIHRPPTERELARITGGGAPTSTVNPARHTLPETQEPDRP
jgi:quinol---cytochrome-c reductase cytochrome b subunit